MHTAQNVRNKNMKKRKIYCSSFIPIVTLNVYEFQKIIDEIGLLLAKIQPVGIYTHFLKFL